MEAQPRWPISNDPKEMTLNEILTTFDTIDDPDAAPLTPVQLEALQNALLDKVDAIKFVLDSWTDIANRHNEYAKDHLEKKRAYEKRVDRLKEYVVYAMRRNDFEKIAGEEWKVSVRRSEVIETTGDPTEAYAELYPDLVRHKIEWNKSEIKSLAKLGHKFPFAEIRENYSPQFSVTVKEKK